MGDTSQEEPAVKEDEELFDTVFLRNVSRFDTTQESLKAHMEENFGETVYCLLCKDRETGESKGTAFVKFKETETAARCLEEFEDRELQTKFFLDGRNLFVLPALTRNQIGVVQKSSAKKDDDDAGEKKKFKKPRHHRVRMKNKDDQGAPVDERRYSKEVAIKKGNSKKRMENKAKQKGKDMRNSEKPMKKKPAARSMNNKFPKPNNKKKKTKTKQMGRPR